MSVIKEVVYTENTDCAKAFASFGMRSDNLVPGVITETLGLLPSHAFSKGEPSSVTADAPKRPWGVWSWSTEGRLSTTIVKDHAQLLLSVLEPKRDQILTYVANSDYYVEIRIGWHTKYLEGGFTLPAPVIQRLSLLCNYLDFGFLARNQEE